MSKYARFGAMVATSTVVMLGLMYLNSTSSATCISARPVSTWRW